MIDKILFYTYFFEFLLQYTVHFDMCQIMQKYSIQIKYAEICKKKKIATNFKLLEYVEIIGTDKNPNNCSVFVSK